MSAMRSRDQNLAWSRDETILLLDLYLRHPSAEARHPEVVALSASCATSPAPRQRSDRRTSATRSASP